MSSTNAIRPVDSWVAYTPSAANIADTVKQFSAIWCDAAGTITAEGVNGVSLVIAVTAGLNQLRPNKITAATPSVYLVWSSSMEGN